MKLESAEGLLIIGMKLGYMACKIGLTKEEMIEEYHKEWKKVKK